MPDGIANGSGVAGFEIIPVVTSAEAAAAMAATL